MLLLKLRETYALNRLSSFKNLRWKGGKFDHHPGRLKVVLRHWPKDIHWRHGRRPLQDNNFYPAYILACRKSSFFSQNFPQTIHDLGLKIHHFGPLWRNVKAKIKFWARKIFPVKNLPLSDEKLQLNYFPPILTHFSLRIFIQCKMNTMHNNQYTRWTK